MLSPETLDRLEATASKYIGLEFSTPIAVNPGDLRELIAVYRQHSLVPPTEKDPAE
jgi:hypothetical protein